MGLSASLFSGITGLGANGERMSVIGNNISNVNTVGFKSTRMHFEDAISQDISTAQGVGQVGRGVKVGAVYSDFGQGSFETTNEATDLAIGGEGFFLLKAKGAEEQYYSRAGNFRFDKDGFLVDPHGYVLQGWEVDQSRTTTQTNNVQSSSNANQTRIKGVPTDVRLENFQSPPRETSSVNVVTNLDSTEASRSNDTSATPNHFFAMAQKWDGQATPPIGQTQYAYQTTLKVYDENGSSHNLTVYYDPVDLTDSGGRKVWEYMVTIDPSEDGRIGQTDSTDPTTNYMLKDTKAAGLLAMGTMTFNAAGEMENMSTFVLKEGDRAQAANSDLAQWVPSDFSQNGSPMLVANFLSKEDASYVDSPNINSKDVLIELDFGLRNKGTTWANTTPATTAATYTNAAADGTTVQGFAGFADPERAALAATSFASGSTTIFQSQDGYAAGFLQNISVDRDGVMTGRYSNGQVLELYVVTLANFNNKWALRRDGGNLFTETRESGPAITNRPNTAGLGSVASNSLEQSNVDLAQEFVKMITTQRGFQANSKIITTTDQMLGEVVQLKR